MTGFRILTLAISIPDRMPIPIGNFISQNMYNGRLKSEHNVSNTNSCRFIDVRDGVEESSGRSWEVRVWSWLPPNGNLPGHSQNLREIEVAIEVAKKLAIQGKSFRIITPYDPQRSLLENALKHAKLPWEDKCFNVDAFQGNCFVLSIACWHRWCCITVLIRKRRWLHRHLPSSFE